MPLTFTRTNPSASMDIIDLSSEAKVYDGARLVPASVATIRASARRVNTVDAFMADFLRRACLKVLLIQTCKAILGQCVAMRMASYEDVLQHNSHLVFFCGFVLFV